MDAPPISTDWQDCPWPKAYLSAGKVRVVTMSMAKAPKAGFKTGDMLFIEQVAAAVSKGNQGLADAYNKAFKEAVADGTIAAISQKYFQEDVTCK